MASKIVKHFVPSLFRITLVKVASPLHKNFNIRTLKVAFKEIQHRNSKSSVDGNQGNGDENYFRAKAQLLVTQLLLIPGHLRESVIETLVEMNNVVTMWYKTHDFMFKTRLEECTFYWRPDGTIDTTKTAEELIQNETIGIIKRFELACLYCLAESVHSLWAEVKADGEAMYFLRINDSLIRFWIIWIHVASHISWIEAAKQFLDIRWFPGGWCLLPRFSRIFPHLTLEDKRKFLRYLENTSFDDLRLCLYTMTKDEEEQSIKAGERNCLVMKLLLGYLSTRPLMPYFIETAKRAWKHVDKFLYVILIAQILDLKKGIKDSVFYELFESFWDMGNTSFKEYSLNCYRERILLCLNEIETRRKQRTNQARNHEGCF